MRDTVQVSGVAAETPKWLLLASSDEDIDAHGCPEDVMIPFTGESATITNITDACATEVSVFAGGAAPVLVTKPGWTPGADKVDVALPPPWALDLRVVAEYPEAADTAKQAVEGANAILSNVRAGVQVTITAGVSVIDPATDSRGAAIHNSQVATAACGDDIAKDPDLYDGTSRQLFVFFIDSPPRWRLGATDWGWTCVPRSNILFVRRGARIETLAHEIGHALGLNHVGAGNLLALYGWTADNLMQSSAFAPDITKAVGRLTLGQVYRASFGDASWLQVGQVRTGESKTCQVASAPDSVANNPAPATIPRWPCPRGTLDWP